MAGNKNEPGRTSIQLNLNTEMLAKSEILKRNSIRNKRLFQEIFPDTAMKLYLVNAPLAVHVLLQMVKMILAKVYFIQVKN